MALAIPSELERLRDGAKKLVNEFTLGQKAVVGVAFLAAIVAGIVFLHLSNQTPYTTLYTGLTASDSSAITQKLTSEHIPFTVADGGTTILVPQNDVYSQRVTLAQAGLPNQNSNVGLSIVSKEGITTSAFQQSVDLQRGLQGELQSTIEAIQGVSNAQVNIVIPNPNSLALNNSPSPSAAVMVTMQPQQSLTSGQVQAIVHLVASSVPGLQADNVTVTDAAGHLLSGPGSNSSLTEQDQATQLYDTATEQAIQSLLTTTLGPNNADVVVNAALNFNKDSKQIHGLLQNADGTVISTPNQINSQSETFSGSSPPPGGVAGSITTIAGSAGSNNNLVNTGNQENLTIGQYQEQINTAPGALVNQSVAVVVNSKALPKGVTVGALQQAVASAANINTARGDIISVQALPFSNASQVAQANAQAQANALARHNEITNALRAAGVLLVLAIILYFMYRSAKKPEEIVEEEPFGELEPGEDYLDEDDEFAQLEQSEEDLEMVPASANPFDLDLAEGIPHELETSSIGEFIENQPDEVARLLRAWMQETKLPGVTTPSNRQSEQQPA